jgi:hypothetical protein
VSSYADCRCASAKRKAVGDAGPYPTLDAVPPHVSDAQPAAKRKPASQKQALTILFAHHWKEGRIASRAWAAVSFSNRWCCRLACARGIEAGVSLLFIAATRAAGM